MVFQNSDRHIFALYFGDTSLFKDKVDETGIIDDAKLYHRLTQVLRFSSGSVCILFDQNYHVTVTVRQIFKKSIELYIENVFSNKPLSPHILLLLPILKRQALVEAVYAAAEAGVSEIQLISTQKVQRNWDGIKELQRLQNVVIAACEQAKYFAIPELKAPISLETALSSVQHDALRIYYDATGSHFNDVLSKVSKSIVALVGPEGDLTQEEKKIVQNHTFNFIRLTPTILRAPQAVTVGIGIIRTTI